MNDRSAPVRHWGSLILRLAIGVTFILHGYPKLFPSGPGGFATVLQTRGFPGPMVLAWIVSLVEFAGGIAMLVGLLVRYVGAVMAIEMLVTTVRVKMPGGVSFIYPKGTGWELDFLLFAIAAALVFLGAGPLSVDGALQSGRSRAG